MRRDLRFDLFRGYALLAILWVHILLGYEKPIAPYFRIVPDHIGISGSAEIFVFISGYVFGMVYGRVLDKAGLIPAYAKSVSRSWQLYITNAFTLMLAYGVFGMLGSIDGLRPIEVWHISTAHQIAPAEIWMALTFRDIPDLFDVLKLFIFFLLLAPAFLILVRSNWKLAAAVTLVFYAAAQVRVPVPDFVWQRGEGFNPVSWQLLFAVGIMLQQKQFRIPRPRILVLTALAVWVLSFLRVWIPPALSYYAVLPQDNVWLARVPYADPELLGPVRLAHFLLVLYIVTSVVPDSDTFRRSRLLRPIIITGQSSLEVFCFGLIETYLICSFLKIYEPGNGIIFAVLLVAMALSIAFAYLVRLWKSEPWSTGASSAEASHALAPSASFSRS